MHQKAVTKHTKNFIHTNQSVRKNFRDTNQESGPGLERFIHRYKHRHIHRYKQINASPGMTKHTKNFTHTNQTVRKNFRDTNQGSGPGLGRFIHRYKHRYIHRYKQINASPGMNSWNLKVRWTIGFNVFLKGSERWESNNG